jgi:NAD(P)-dependent dehydrogenase (short-subunit alcohol dehydrogenase family)
VTTFTASAVPDLTGKTVIVTGASSGVGLETSRALARAGARVVLAVRDIAKGREAARHMTGVTEFRALDLSSLDSVRAFAAAWQGPVDLLVNNAGATPPTALTLSEDGFELQFATNHLGHFALTNLLLESVTGRVVTVASLAARAGRLDFGDLTWERRGYRPLRVYNATKLANLLFAAELQRRLTAAGSKVLSVAAHPGFVSSGIYRDSGALTRSFVRLTAQSASQGALPVLYAAVGDIAGGSFTGPASMGHMRGAPQLIKSPSAAQDTELAARLWTVSEELTGISWPLRASAGREDG